MSGRLQIGTLLDDYRIVGFLGAGGMGAVYHGVHTKIDRPVAIKLLTSVGGHSSFKERFFNEARVQSTLQHPNIATLYDFRESGDLLYIVMEYVDGETLETLIKGRVHAVEDALAVFSSVCEAVRFLHSSKVVHRDIKPQNIKVASNGSVKLLDFGIAKDSDSQGLTRVGGIIGTPDYLAPEQLIGHPANDLTDIWALGVLLYEMLTGVSPFKGQGPAEVYKNITSGRFEPPERLNPAVPTDVSRIVTRCLAVDSVRRYQSVDQIIGDLTNSRRRYGPSAPLHTPQRRVSLPGERSFNEIIDGATGTISRTGSLGLTSGGRGPVIAVSAVAALIVVAGVIGLAAWAFLTPTVSDPVSAASNKQALVAKTSPTRNANSATLSTQSHQSAPAGQTGVTIEVVDGPTQVYRDGQLIGTTPLIVDGNENQNIELTLKRDGYEDQDENVEITTRKKVFTFSLKKKK